jgi:hypothetical protein
MAIDEADVLDAVATIGKVVERFGGAGVVIGEALEIAAEAVKAASKIDGDPVAMLRSLKQHLRDTVFADLQKALDEDDQ